MDRIIRGISKDKNLRFIAVDATETVRRAATIHQLSITNSVLLGRLLSAGLMMASDLKGEKNVLTLKVEGDGPSKKALVTARKNGFIKGLVGNPKVELPLTENTKKIDVAKAIGKGTLSVIKDLGLKRPYIGQIELQFGTIARDLTYYFAKSEQTPSSVGLGVLVMPNGKIKQAGGFILQMMPDPSEELITKIEKNLYRFPNLTDMMDLGHSIEHLIEEFILKDIALEIKKTQNCEYHCDCSREKFAEGLKLLSKRELKDAIQKKEEITVNCHFCKSEYKFGKSELERILQQK